MTKGERSFDTKLKQARENALLLLDPDYMAIAQWLAEEEREKKKKETRRAFLVRRVMELQNSPNKPV